MIINDHHQASPGSRQIRGIRGKGVATHQAQRAVFNTLQHRAQLRLARRQVRQPWATASNDFNVLRHAPLELRPWRRGFEIGSQ